MSDKNWLRNFNPSKKNLALRGELKKLATPFFMVESKKLAGRPEMKEGKRIKKIDTRFTEDEYKQVLALEKELGINKTDLIRMRLLNDAKQVVINSRELIKLLDAVGVELGRSGNNINQLAKHANVLKLQGAVPPSVAVKFNELLREYIKIQEDLQISLRKVIRAVGD